MQTSFLRLLLPSSALIDDHATTIIVHKLQRFLARMAQWNDLSGAGLKPALSTRKFARQPLNKLNARVFKLGRGFPSITDEARHRLRISLKKLRYGAEYFGSLFDRPRKIRPYIDRAPVFPTSSWSIRVNI